MLDIDFLIIVGVQVAVVLVCLKYFFLFASVPVLMMEQVYKKHRGSKLAAIFHIPQFIDNHLFAGMMHRKVMFAIARLPLFRTKRIIYRLLGAKLGRGCMFHFNTELRAPELLTVGDGCIIGDNAILDAQNGLTLGKHVNISSNVSVYTLQHDHRHPNFGYPDPMQRKMSVEIGDRAWLGSNVVVLPGVVIGEGAVCCAGCVVTKDVEPFAVVAGIPAKKVGERPKNITYEFVNGYMKE